MMAVPAPLAENRRFAAFGYFAKKSGGGAADQQPFYLSHRRP